MHFSRWRFRLHHSANSANSLIRCCPLSLPIRLRMRHFFSEESASAIYPPAFLSLSFSVHIIRTDRTPIYIKTRSKPFSLWYHAQIILLCPASPHSSFTHLSCGYSINVHSPSPLSFPSSSHHRPINLSDQRNATGLCAHARDKGCRERCRRVRARDHSAAAAAAAGSLRHVLIEPFSTAITADSGDFGVFHGHHLDAGDEDGSVTVVGTGCRTGIDGATLLLVAPLRVILGLMVDWLLLVRN